MRHALAVALLSASIGMPAAFFTVALPVLMRDGGASLAEVGLSYVVWLPSALKWLWAPLVERQASRGGWARQGLAAGVVLVMALAFLPVAGLAERVAVPPLLALSLLSSALAVTLQMVLVHWLIETQSEARRARLNGVAAAAMVLGGILGGGLMPWLATKIGWELAVPGLAVLIAAAAPAALLLDGSGAARPAPGRLPELFAQLLATFRGPNGRRRGLVALLFGAMAGADATIPARLIDAGHPPAEVFLLLGTVAALLMAPAALATGPAISRFGLGRVIALLCLVKGAILLLLALDPGRPDLLAVGDFTLGGALTVATWQLYQRLSTGSLPVTRYSALTALDAGLRFLAGALAGSLAMGLGYAPLYAGSALLCLLAAALLPRAGRSA